MLTPLRRGQLTDPRQISDSHQLSGPRPRPIARPLYIWAVDALYEMIESGAYTAGQLLPSEGELAAYLGVSRSTLREALGYLEKDGFIVRKHGVGTFVAPHTDHISSGLERLASFRSVAELAGASVEVVDRSVSQVAADESVAEVLQVPPCAELVRVEITVALDDRPVAYLDGLIDGRWVAVEQLSGAGGSLLEYMCQRPDLPMSYSRSELYAIEANGLLAARLGVAEGKAILNLAETVFSDKHVPLAVFRNYFVTDCYNFKIVRRIVRSHLPGNPSGGFQDDSGKVAREP